jgi:biotin carboxyl carrier protein
MCAINLEQHINGKGSNMPVNFKLSTLVSELKKMKLSFGFSKKKFWVALLVALVVIGSGSMIYYKYAYLPDQKTDEPAMQTAIVRQGDLVIYASGSGTLIAADEVDLAFKTGGQVMEVFVKVGDEVNSGDLLAQVDDTSAQINYTLAKRILLELTSATAVATAQQAMAQASLDLDDAMRYTPEGGRVLLSAEQVGETLEMRIQDNSPGLSEEELGRVFDRFYRADPSRQRDESGSGLGLAIAKSLVERHNGRIWAESQPGQGVTVVLGLPVEPGSVE